MALSALCLALGKHTAGNGAALLLRCLQTKKRFQENKRQKHDFHWGGEQP